MSKAVVTEELSSEETDSGGENADVRDIAPTMLPIPKQLEGAFQPTKEASIEFLGCSQHS